jgi:ribosomal protein L9
MAMQAQADVRKRIVEVNRLKLIETLEANRTTHIKEYEEAKRGYKAELLTKLDQAVAEARKTIEKQYAKRQKEVAEINDEDIEKQEDYVRLFDGITITMKVPRSFAKEYDAAIDIAKWDVRDTLELSHAEFTCFVRDEWDWKSDFIATSKMYNAK